MDDLMAWVIALVLLGLVAGYTYLQRDRGEGGPGDSRYARDEHRHMPGELRRAKLMFSEAFFRTDRPGKFCARVDQVFLCRGALVPMETKTRSYDRVRLYDIIELSVQALVLRHALNGPGREHPVATWGWVRIVQKGRVPTYRRVDLLSEAQVLQLEARRKELLSGKRAPRGPVTYRMCAKCSFLPKCKMGQGMVASRSDRRG